MAVVVCVCGGVASWSHQADSKNISCQQNPVSKRSKSTLLAIQTSQCAMKNKIQSVVCVVWGALVLVMGCALTCTRLNLFSIYRGAFLPRKE